MTKVCGIILAGGNSKRFGSPKAFLKRCGQAFYMYSLQAVQPFVEQAIIVTNEHLASFFPKDEQFILIKDVERFKGQGPLSGIFSVMEHFHYSWYLVVPIDVPFIEKSIFQTLLAHRKKNSQVILPAVNGKKEPLIAVYHHSVKDVIKKQLIQGKRSVHQMLKEVSQVTEIEMKDCKSFVNINRKSDYAKYILNKDDGL